MTATAGPLDGDQVQPLGAFEITPSHQIAQHVDRQRFALRQGVDDESHFWIEFVQSPADHVADALRYRDVAIPHPDAGRHPHPARGHLVLHELVQKQRVSAGELPEAARSAGVHGTIEGTFDHRARGVDGQRLQVQSGEQAVLPQGGDGIRRLRACPQRHHEAGAAAVGKLMNDVRGQAVEKVRIVDADEDPTLSLLSDKGIDHVPHIGHGIGNRVAYQCREGSEWKRPRRFGADDPVRAFPRVLGAREDFAGEPGLSDPRGPHDHDAGILTAPAERATNRCELAVASRQRIPADHGATIARLTCSWP